MWLIWPFKEIKHLAIPLFVPNIYHFEAVVFTSGEKFEEIRNKKKDWEKKEIRLRIFIKWGSLGDDLLGFQGHLVQI